MSILIAALVIFMHRKNIQRLRLGEESKLSFKKKPTAEVSSDSDDNGKASR